MRKPSARPNIIVLHTDQQRFDTIAAAGFPVMHTPNLDRLAASGALLERFSVQAPVCMPSRASMLSGRYPNAAGVTCNGPRMPEGVRCIQHMLSDAGYFTGMIGKLHFLPHSARDHREPHPRYGFDHLQVCDEPGCYRDAYREWVAEQDPSQLDAVNCGLPPARAQWEQMMGWRGSVQPPVARGDFTPQVFRGDDHLTNARFVADRSIQFLHERGSRPFFLFAGFYHPHSPLIPPQWALDRYDPQSIPLPPGDRRVRMPGSDRELSDTEVREIDCITHAPCIIRYPGQVGAGSRIAGMVEGVDLVPTLLEYAGVVRELSLQGRSMRRLIEGDHGAARESVYCEFASPSRSNGAAVRTEQWFYARNAFGGEMLHDLQADPHELRNVIDEADSSSALSEMRALALERSLHARSSVRLEARY